MLRWAVLLLSALAALAAPARAANLTLTGPSGGGRCPCSSTSRDYAPSVRLGLEYLGFGPFSLRAGYRTMTSSQRAAALGKALGSTAPGLSEFYGMFMGMGFRSRLGNLDYTLTPYGELGNAHRFLFSTRFGGGAAPGGAPAGKLVGVMP